MLLISFGRRVENIFFFLIKNMFAILSVAFFASTLTQKAIRYIYNESHQCQYIFCVKKKRWKKNVPLLNKFIVYVIINKHTPTFTALQISK